MRRPATARGLLAALQVEQPAVPAIDDAQWVDRESLEALVFALRRLDEASVLSVVAGQSNRQVAPTCS